MEEIRREEEVLVLDAGIDSEEVNPTSYICCWGAYTPYRG